MTILRVLLEEYEKTEPDMLKKRIQAAYRLFEQKISHRKVCSVLRLNRSSVYKHRKAISAPCARKVEDSLLVVEIQAIQAKH